ncbi:hypothetical protein PV327_002840 [Microctonus hyperodae]|uniref:Uncharacterized protein n=1 Tax=Microctonus hyperodae TaxID=165561 RepID=A0AA39FGD3_MICHY|nr:hypothetical protein PV327_002840 [Microctonus hyperodae]
MLDYNNLGDDNELIKIKKHYYNRMQSMNYAIVMTLTLFGVVHLITSWRGRHYPMPIWIPHEIDINIPFWISFIFSSLSCWIHIVFIMSYDLIFSGHLTLLAMHLDILKHRFTIISQLNKLNRKTYLTQYNLYSLNTWVSVQFILAVLVKWAIQCWEATIVMQKSIEIGDAVYNLNWIDFNKSTAISVMIIIRRSSIRPIIFYGVLAIPLSINTLKTVGLSFH